MIPTCAVELDVVEVERLGPQLDRVRVRGVHQVGVRGVPEVRVLVQGDLAVEGQHAAVGGPHQRVDLDQRGVLLGQHVPQLHEHVGHGVGDVGGEVRGGDDLPRLLRGAALEGVHADHGQGLGVVLGDLLDLHPALDRGHRQEGAVRPIEQEGDVVLLGDLRGLGDQDLVHGVALDVHPEDVGSAGAGLILAVGELHAACLAAAAHLHLGLDHHRAADAAGGQARRIGRLADGAGDDRHAMLPEQVLGLVLIQIHAGLLTDEGTRTTLVTSPRRSDGRSLVRRRAVVMLRQAACATFSLTQSTISSVRVPGVNTWATPIS